MSTDQNTPPPKPSAGQAAVILKTIGDTTWRMFVPTIGGMLLGLWGDMKLHSMPWGMLVGLAFGTLITTQLIRRQFNKVNATKEQ